MKLSHLRLVITLASILIIPSGCGRGRSRQIAVVPETTGTELWESLHAGVEQRAAHTGYEIYWNAPTREDDVEGQISLAEAAIRRKDAGLIIAPDHYLALLTPIHEAQMSGMPVAIIRSALPVQRGPNLSFFLNDDDAMGRSAARYMAKVIDGHGAVAVVGVNPNLIGIMRRFKSFEAEIKEHYPEIAVVDRVPDALSAAEAQQSSEVALAAHPDLKAIVALTTTSSEGGWAAVNALGRGKEVKLIGCDQELDLMAAVRRGQIDGVMVENTYEMGVLAAGWILDHNLRGTPGTETLVQPLLVTKANIDAPFTQLVLSANWRPR